MCSTSIACDLGWSGSKIALYAEIQFFRPLRDLNKPISRPLNKDRQLKPRPQFQ